MLYFCYIFAIFITLWCPFLGWVATDHDKINEAPQCEPFSRTLPRDGSLDFEVTSMTCINKGGHHIFTPRGAPQANRQYNCPIGPQLIVLLSTVIKYVFHSLMWFWILGNSYYMSNFMHDLSLITNECHDLLLITNELCQYLIYKKAYKK